MSRTVIVTFLVALLCGATSAEDDPVDKNLTTAKEDFGKAAEKARTGLLADLKKKLDTVQKAGDLMTLEKIQAELKAFEERGDLPKSVPTKSYESQMRIARTKLEEAYGAAVKQYTKDGKIALAKTIQEELDEFKKGGPPKPDGRNRWVHEKGEFKLIKDCVWEEKSPNGKTYQFKEVSRTKDYIEIDAINGDTSLRYRLYNERCDSGKKPKPVFKTLFSKGKWEK